MLSFRDQMMIAMTQSIIARYGAVIGIDEIASMLGLESQTVKNKLSRGGDDLPPFTQLKGKQIVMAQDLAEWMLCNDRAKL